MKLCQLKSWIKCVARAIDLKTQFEGKLQERKEPLTPFHMLQQIQAYWVNHETHFEEAMAYKNQAANEANNVKKRGANNSAHANNASHEVPKKQKTGTPDICTYWFCSSRPTSYTGL